MAKKKDLANPLFGLESSKSNPAKGKKNLGNPLSSVPSSEVRRATNPKGKDTTMAGRYRRRSILIEPEMDEAINEKVDELGIGKMELIRYLIAVGLESLNSGNVPVKKEVVATKLEMPEWRD